MGKSQPPGLFYHQGDIDNVNLVMTYYHHYLKQSGEEYENLTSGQTLPCVCVIVVIVVTMLKKSAMRCDKNYGGKTDLTEAVAEAKSKRKNIFVLHKP